MSETETPAAAPETPAVKPKGKTFPDAGRGDLYMMRPEDIIIIGHDTPDGPEHELCDPESNATPCEDDKEKIANIAHYGVIQSVTVRKGPGGAAEAVAGRKRIRYARAANILLRERGAPEIRVPCILRREATPGAFIGVMITENEIRTNKSQIGQCRDAVRMINGGHTRAQVAVAYGKTPETIDRWLAVMDMDPSVHEMMDRGEVNIAVALTVADLPPKKQAKALRDAVKAVAETGRKASAPKVAAKVQEAEKAEAVAQGATNDSETTAPRDPGSASVPPPARISLRVLRQIVDTKPGSLSPDVVAVLRWSLTGEGEADVPGLTEALDNLFPETIPDPEAAAKAKAEKDAAKAQAKAEKDAAKAQAKAEKDAAKAQAKARVKAEKDAAKPVKAPAKAAPKPAKPVKAPAKAAPKGKAPAKAAPKSAKPGKGPQTTLFDK